MTSVVMYSGSAERRPSTRPVFFGKAENLILNAGQITLKGGPFFPLPTIFHEPFVAFLAVVPLRL
jgi:hypothetical protein